MVLPKPLLKRKKLVKGLNEKRALEYYNWLEVGWCLHNIDDRLIDEWISRQVF